MALFTVVVSASARTAYNRQYEGYVARFEHLTPLDVAIGHLLAAEVIRHEPLIRSARTLLRSALASANATPADLDAQMEADIAKREADAEARLDAGPEDDVIVANAKPRRTRKTKAAA